MSRKIQIGGVAVLLVLLGIVTNIVNPMPNRTPPALSPEQKRMRKMMNSEEEFIKRGEKMKATELYWQKKMRDKYGPAKDTHTDEWFTSPKNSQAGMQASNTKHKEASN
jgi:hypothetical protein